jgi:hypothetical protein
MIPTFGHIGKRSFRICSHADIDEILRYLTQVEFRGRTIRKTSADIGISGQTIRDRHKARTQPGNEDWFPLANGHANFRVLTPRSRQAVAEFIKASDIHTGIGATRALDKLLCLDVYAGQTPKDRHRDHFVASSLCPYPFLGDLERRPASPSP